MKRISFLAALAAVLVLAAPAAAAPVFSFVGHGWGHAIGMAQWGSRGFAERGWTYDRILAHYYQGTTLGPAGTSTIRVLLASGRSEIEVSSERQFRVVDATGKRVEVIGSARLDSGLRLAAGGETTELEAPVRVLAGGSPLRFGRPYRGSLVVTVAGGKLQVVNRLPLERYLWGVVPGEMPSGWHQEALKTQAVAARTYALVSRKTSGSFDVFADTRSQVYGGVGVEQGRTTAAVNATKGEIVLWEGKPAWTYFSSSSGGRTAAIEDVWEDAAPVPYLVSVDDPHDVHSPHHDWGPVSFTGTELRARLGNRLPAEIVDVRVAVNDSGRAGSVTFVGAGGATVRLSGWDVRIGLGLKSTWFRVDGLSLEPSARRITYGQRVRLTGVAGGAERVRLDRRPAGGGWSLLRTLTPDDDGSFTSRVRPQVSTAFRARAGKLATAPVLVEVAPKVVLEPAGDGGIGGSVEPARGGVPVTIQRRRAGGGWEDVTTAVTEADGSFTTGRDLGPGTYRARVPAGAGLAAGLSRPRTLP
jgi:stage II sporulation protein D